GHIVEDMIDPNRYAEVLGEAVADFSYMKMPYYKARGYPAGIYRVGPLARLNIADHAGTPLADQEPAAFKDLHRGPVLSSFHFHSARLIEIVFAIERMNQWLDEPYILDTHVRARARVNRNEGIGVAEAPRGTLIHHYKIDDEGQITWCNFIIATGHNNL